MRWLIGLCLLIGFAVPTQAHHPDWKKIPVLPTIDRIGPLGRHLPLSHRRRFNRPTYWGGKIAYYIAPSSQEAMAWHNNAHRDAYKKHRPRIEVHYFYPKPWESVRIGARKPTLEENKAGIYAPPQTNVLDDPAEELSVPTLAEPLAGDNELIEE